MTRRIANCFRRSGHFLLFILGLTIVPASAIDQSSLNELAVAKNWTNHFGLTAISWGSNRVDVFAVGQDQSLQHKFYDGAWHEWESLGGILASAPSVISLKEGHLSVFVRATDNAIWHRNFEDGTWHGWYSIGGEFIGGPQATSQGTNFIEVIAEGMDHTLRRIRWNGSWQGWEVLKAPQEGTRYSRRWQTEDGLPHNSVYAIAQTRDGYLWIGTHRGLARFDGVRFTVFNPQNTPGLKGQIIRSLCQTRDSTLWIGTESGGLSFLKDGKVARSSLVSSESIKVLFESTDGALWIGTTNGLVRYKDGQCDSFTTANGLQHNAVLALCEDRSGNLWIGTSRGLTRYKNGFHEVYHDAYFLPMNTVRTLFCDRQGSLWIGTGGGGIARLRNGEWSYFKKPEGLPDLFVTAVCEDRGGQLWVGTLGGLCRFDGNKFVTELNSEGVSYESVFCITEDTESNLWIGTKEGLTQLRFQPFRSYTTQQGLPHNNVMSVCEDAGGTLWTTTWGRGLSGMKDGKIVTYNRSNSSLYDLLLSFCQTRDGSIWLGSDHDGGLFQFKKWRIPAVQQKRRHH